MTALSAGIIVTTPEQLRAILREEVEAALAERAPSPAPCLLDRRGLAEALDCGVDTIDKLRREGLPTVMLIESPRFELAAVLAWLREGRAAK